MLHIDPSQNVAIRNCNEAVFPPCDAVVPQLNGAAKKKKKKKRKRKHPAQASSSSDAFGQCVASYILFTHLHIWEAKSIQLARLLLQLFRAWCVTDAAEMQCCVCCWGGTLELQCVHKGERTFAVITLQVGFGSFLHLCWGSNKGRMNVIIKEDHLKKIL